MNASLERGRVSTPDLTHMPNASSDFIQHHPSRIVRNSWPFGTIPEHNAQRPRLAGEYRAHLDVRGLARRWMGHERISLTPENGNVAVRLITRIAINNSTNTMLHYEQYTASLGLSLLQMASAKNKATSHGRT